jgi:hypothetical protein
MRSMFMKLLLLSCVMVLAGFPAMSQVVARAQTPSPLLAIMAPALMFFQSGPESERIAALEKQLEQQSVAITPASGFVSPMASLAIGVVAGIGCFFMVVKVKAIFGYDDSLDAFGVHGAGGTMGALLTGIFANSAINPIFGAGKPTGLLEGNGRQLFHQAVGVAIAWSLSIAGTLIILFIVDKTIGLRVSAEDEATGLDLSQHGEEGYEWAH